MYKYQDVKGSGVFGEMTAGMLGMELGCEMSDAF